MLRPKELDDILRRNGVREFWREVVLAMVARLVVKTSAYSFVIGCFIGAILCFIMAIWAPWEKSAPVVKSNAPAAIAAGLRAVAK